MDPPPPTLRFLTVVYSLLLLLPTPSAALYFEVSGIAPKCISEYIHANVLVLAHYSVASHGSSHHTISLKVSSPYGKPLHEAESVAGGKFGFTASEAGTYIACFWLPKSESSHVLSVELDWKMGVTAKDWDLVSKKHKIEGVELELMKVQGAIETIRENMLYLRERERQMRDVSEHANGMVAWFGISSLMICLLVAGWQLWHIHNFFQRKKLL